MCCANLENKLFEFAKNANEWALKHKDSPLVYVISAISIVAGFTILGVSAIIQKYYLLFLLLIPISFIGLSIKTFGIPFPFHYSESSYLFFETEFAEDKFREDANHFLSACCCISFPAMIGLIYGQDPREWSFILLSFFGLLIMSCGSCVFAYIHFPPVCVEDPDSENDF